jgi:hypothetical protein
VGDLLWRVVLWRVGLQWYLFALLGLPALMILGTLVRPGALGSFDLSAQPLFRFCRDIHGRPETREREGRWQ